MQEIISFLTAIAISIGVFFAPVIEYVKPYAKEITKQAKIARQSFENKNLGATDANVQTDLRALFESSLSAGISSSETEFTLTSGTDKDGTALASSTYAFIIDEGTSDEEFVRADCTGSSTSTVCVGAARGISVRTGTSTVSSLQKAHRRGASVKITDAPSLITSVLQLRGIETIHAPRYYKRNFTFSTSSMLLDKAYADALTISGAPDSSLTVKGIVEIASGLELASSTSAGGTTAPLVPRSTSATDTPSSLGSQRTSLIPVSNLLGYISQKWLNLTEEFSFSGASTTISGTLNVGGNATTSQATTTALNISSANLRINGIAQYWPPTQAATSSTPINDGAGKIIWSTELETKLLPDVILTSASSTVGITNLPARSEYRIVVSISTLASAAAARLRFNLDGTATYGYTVVEDTTNCGQAGSGCASADTQILLAGTATTSLSHFEIRVHNEASLRKLVEWKGSASSGTTARPTNYIGSAVWNNSSDLIKDIELLGGGVNFNTGTKISVYGKN